MNTISKDRHLFFTVCKLLVLYLFSFWFPLPSLSVSIFVSFSFVLSFYLFLYFIFLLFVFYTSHTTAIAFTFFPFLVVSMLLKSIVKKKYRRKKQNTILSSSRNCLSREKPQNPKTPLFVVLLFLIFFRDVTQYKTT